MSTALDYAALYKELELDEGRRSKPYTDTKGKITIGVGRNLTDRGLSPKEINYLLDNDIDICESELDSNLPWWRDHTAARRRVLVNLVFNMGITKVLKFKNTLAAFQRRDWEGVVDGLRKSKWYNDVGPGRAGRLFKLVREG